MSPDNLNMNKQINKLNTIKTIELFAGVGGFRVGLENVKNDKK